MATTKPSSSTCATSPTGAAASKKGQAALYSALELLRAVRVDLEPVDISYILGNNFISHGIARGLESSISPLVLLLTSLEPDELFSNLEQASAFVMSDRHPDENVQNRLNQAARWDLFSQGLLDDSSERSRRTALGRTRPAAAPERV